MIAALSYDAGSAIRAQKLVDRIAELQWPATFLLCREIEAPELESPGALKTTYIDKVLHHPESKNLAFQAVAVYVAAKIRQPFLYLETDCVPSGDDWFARIEAEYTKCGRPYMGVIVPASRPHASPQHMAAIAVYPWQLIQLSGGDALIANEEPFPAAMARGGMLKFVFPTLLIQHDWEGKGVADGVALYHPDRDGSVLKNLSGVERPNLSKTPSGSEDSAQTNTQASVDDLTTPAQNTTLVRSLEESKTELTGNGGLPARGTPPEIRRDSRRDGQIQPWANKLDSQEEIKRLCLALKAFCTQPLYTSYVRHALADAGVISQRKGVRRLKKKKMGGKPPKR